MPITYAVTPNNRLLALLPEKDLEHLLGCCEAVDFMLADVINHAGELISHVYFPTSCFISLIVPIDAGENLEVGLVGTEGMLGASVILDVTMAPFHAIVQGSGSALRIPVATFVHELEINPALQSLIKRYLYVTMRQLAQTAACTHFHVVEARLARWLLMTQDRAHSEHFHVTHVFLAYILGVRRVGVTKAAHSLQKQKLISYQRGNINILDRNGLKTVACGCYRVDKETYQHILG